MRQEKRRASARMLNQTKFLRVVWAQSQPIFQWSDRLPMVVLVKVGPEHWERYWAQILDRGRRRGDCTTTCSPLRWPDLF